MLTLLKRLWLQERGSVFVMAALTAMGVIGSVGIAVDAGRAQMAQNKLQNSLDAAGLAAGASLSTADLEPVVRKYVRANFAQGNLGAVIEDDDIHVVISDDAQLITVTATASLATTFMKIFGHDTVNLHAETEITRTNKGMELALVLDITGSMCIPSCTGRLDALKTASNDLFEILFGEGKTTADNLWIGIVPFSMGINIGSTHTDWLNAAYSDLDWGTTSWRGCTEARWASGNDLTDATPTTEKFFAYYWQDDGNNDWLTPAYTTSSTSTTTLCGPTSSNSCRCTTSSGGTYICGTVTNGNVQTVTSCSGSSSNKKCTKAVTTTTQHPISYNINSTRGPNTYCPTSEVTRLTNNRTTLETAINGLSAVGGTHIPTGAVWGWRMLSPLWRGLWGGSMDTNSLPLDYNTPLMVKAVILMTDGQNTMYSIADGAYGYTAQNYTGMATTPYTDTKAAAQLDNKLSTICTNMKNKGIIVYTVLFDVDDDTTENMLRTCASQPDYFFNSPDAEALKKAFKTIGDSLANLRISR